MSVHGKTITLHVITRYFSCNYVSAEVLRVILREGYSLKRNVLSLNPSIYFNFYVFDHTVKPTLLYGSEIGACSLSKKITIDDLFEFSHQGNISVQK